MTTNIANRNSHRPTAPARTFGTILVDNDEDSLAATDHDRDSAGPRRPASNRMNHDQQPPASHRNLLIIRALITPIGVLGGALITLILRYGALVLAIILLSSADWRAAQAQQPGTTFTCVAPSHHDGDNIRCKNIEGRMRLYGIDAPEMPGACQAGRRCAPGNPYASRDHLRALTANQNIRCTVMDRDRYNRLVVRCQTAQGTDLSCAQIRAGHAIARYGTIQCRP